MFSNTLVELRNIQLNNINKPSQIDTTIIIRCMKCQELKGLAEFWNQKGNTGRYFKQSHCKSCSNRTRRDLPGCLRTSIRKMLGSCRSSAKKRGLMGRLECSEMSLTEEHILELKEKQNNKCLISGVKLK